MVKVHLHVSATAAESKSPDNLATFEDATDWAISQPYATLVVRGKDGTIAEFAPNSWAYAEKH